MKASRFKYGDYVRGLHSKSLYKIIGVHKETYFNGTYYYLAEEIYHNNKLNYVSEANAVPLSEAELVAIKVGANVEKFSS